ncbi:MAG: MmgE/PrpD family protein [Nitrososphaerales archaeon]
MNLAEHLADYAYRLSYEDLDAKVVSEAKKRIVDALGCAIGAFDERPVRISRKVASSISAGGTSTLLGTDTKTAPDLAAFVNGLMIRYFDFNDTYLSKEPAHPSDNIGATLSVAESVGARGKDLILSTVLAYEVQCRLCDSADIRHRGWDHVCYGLVSSALASGKLLKLDRNELTQAVNIALNAHIAMRQVRAGELSMWKGASFSNAARNAVFSALLAKEGMKGPSPIFEGEMGFFKQVSGPFKLDVEDFGGRKGNFKLNDTYVKYWPVEYHAQTAVWAALDLRKRVGGPRRIKSVLVETHEAGYTILAKDREKWRPSTKETADHSLPYIVGMALLEGKVDNSTYADGNLKDTKILKFVGKVRVREDSKLSAMYPARGMPNRVSVELDGGKIESCEVAVPRGHPANPMTSEEVESKFYLLTRRLLGKESASRALGRLWNLEKVEDLGMLAGLFQIK